MVRRTLGFWAENSRAMSPRKENHKANKPAVYGIVILPFCVFINYGLGFDSIDQAVCGPIGDSVDAEVLGEKAGHV